MRISKRIKEEAIKMQACPSIVDNWEKMGMAEKYHEGVKWCMEREYPSYEVMKKYDKEAIAYGIYNKKTVNIIADKEQYAFNGSIVNLTIDGFKVCRVFMGRGTKLHVTVKDDAIVVISNYGGEITKLVSGNGRCIIWDKELEI